MSPQALSAGNVLVDPNARPKAQGRHDRHVESKRRAEADSPAAHFAEDSVKLSLQPRTASGAWTIRIENEGPVPARVVADIRLLSLDVTPRGAHRPLHCELPTAMRPTDELERSMVIPPKRAFAETFSPRLYCFGASGFSALTGGSTVSARLALVGPASPAIWEVAPMDGDLTHVARRKWLEAPPVLLPDDPTPVAARTPPAHDDASDAPQLVFEVPEAVDAPSAEEVEVPVTLRNKGSSPVTVAFRPEVVRFDVTSGPITTHCSWPVQPTAPLRELFTSLAPGASTELTLMLDAYCREQAFEHAGLLIVRPWADMQHDSGAPIGLRSFDGRISANRPVFVRLQRGTAIVPWVKPRLTDP
jgi:hypothetical protein